MNRRQFLAALPVLPALPAGPGKAIRLAGRSRGTDFSRPRSPLALAAEAYTRSAMAALDRDIVSGGVSAGSMLP